MEFGHNFAETLRKEVREEMGLEVTWMADKPLYTWHMKRERMRGMDWFHILLLAFPFEVKDLNITPSEECHAIKFFSKWVPKLTNSSPRFLMISQSNSCRCSAQSFSFHKQKLYYSRLNLTTMGF